MQLKVMTFNLLRGEAENPAGPWSERFPLALDVLRGNFNSPRMGPDIITLQEATAPQLADLEAVLTEFTIVRGPESGEMRLPRMVNSVSSFLGRARRKRAVPTPVLPSPALVAGATRAKNYRGEHCAILYRTAKYEQAAGNAFWLSHESEVPGSVLRGTVLPRVVNWVRLKDRDTGAPVTVFNAHLDFLPWASLRSARILRRVLDTFWDGSPQILMGDFNAHPGSSAYKYLGRELRQSPNPPLADAYLTAGERVGPKGTYHGGTGRVRWTGRLDRILFRPTLSVERVTTITHHRSSFYPSDHYPVFAELREK